MHRVHDDCMTGEDGADNERLEELSRDIEANTAGIEALKGRADEQGLRVSAGEAQGVEHHDRIGQLEGRADMDAILIAVLQAEGTLNKEHAANLEEALRSSRTIGTAIGVVMAMRKISDVDAFELLRKSSMDSNRKLRDVAEEIVFSGDVKASQAAQAPRH